MAPRRQVARKRKPSIDLKRTLGPLVVNWIERELVHGPGDVEGQRIELDDERVRFLLHAYAIDDRGRRTVRRAVLSRSKGWAKSEFAAMIACAEAIGPVRFAGWDHDGRPLGRAQLAPYIPLVATEEGQAGNTYAAAEYMLRYGAISRLEGLDVGLTRTFVPGGGKIVALSAKASSKEGGKETFAVFDETHLYVTEELRRLHATIRRNLAKRKAAEPWSLETSTMYAPGESSIAETSHAYWEAISSGSISDQGFLFDHLQGPRDLEWDDDEELRAALVVAYGHAAEWIDFERLVAEARDPDTDQADFRRYFLNQPTERTAGKWITDERWRECASKIEIPDGSEVVVGVDAAKTRDCTACNWSWRDPESGKIVQRIRVWSARRQNPHHELVAGGRIDNDDVRDFILDELMERFQVRLLFYDERYFDTQAHDLSQVGLTVVEMHQGATEMNAAWDLYYDLVHVGEPRIAHDGDPVFASHVRNALGKRTGNRARNWRVEKAGDGSIDGLAAAVMGAYAIEHFDEFLGSKPMVAWA
jgi:phage terminase large subunit-like protein